MSSFSGVCVSGERVCLHVSGISFFSFHGGVESRVLSLVVRRWGDSLTHSL